MFMQFSTKSDRSNRFSVQTQVLGLNSLPPFRHPYHVGNYGSATDVLTLTLSETSKAFESFLKLKTYFLANIWYEPVSLSSMLAYTVTLILKLPLFYAPLISPSF